ncbi:hypothetical protein PsAD2_01820 [Pseudovibrio axinellae]|uniref:Uncharacterized protein n=1 Tax=Pseudovibrio axinellae TaxID=989403 RepID=A0A165Z628_9HYPH|nr:hypothetical protein PsAD2_01820 [Pseudovibrio axinellae]SEQ31195.1 hypothetical protein SAMN05421798_102381 [Pseudovibrio axinellae]
MDILSPKAEAAGSNPAGCTIFFNDLESQSTLPNLALPAPPPSKLVNV